MFHLSFITKIGTEDPVRGKNYQEEDINFNYNWYRNLSLAFAFLEHSSCYSCLDGGAEELLSETKSTLGSNTAKLPSLFGIIISGFRPALAAT